MIVSDVLKSYYDQAFTDAGEGGSIYNPMTVFERAGHDRKGFLLSNLELPNLSELTVVDYGVGSWGFGCVFPKLKACQIAIGIDISQYAVECSTKISQLDPELQGKEVKFFTSTGYDIQLENESADVIFAGECIEHIEDTEAFLSEIWRILKPEGIAIFTTPNSLPYLYKQKGIRWAMGFEHVALMDSKTLLEYLRRFFDIDLTIGYTSTILPEIDSLITNIDYANGLASLCETDFDNASGLIVTVRKSLSSQNYEIGKYSHVILESDCVKCTPTHKDLSLYDNVLGRMSVGNDSYLSILVPETSSIRCQIILWSHPWSGVARIETSNFSMEIDLYSHISGCTRVNLEEEDLKACEEIKIYTTGKKRDVSQGCEVIFFRAVFASKQ